jgi:phospholipid/cholesterol/gamma-HCH transport system substrate-binding protein
MQKKHAIIVGVFIIIGLAILVVTVFTLGGQKDAFVKKVTLNANFDDVNGLQTGNNIWFSGVKVGTVKKIRLKGNSNVTVILNIDREAIPFIHKDSKVKISTDGFIGNKIVVIYGGSANAAPVEEDDYLTTQIMLGTDDMMATLQENNKNLLEITNNFKKISKNIADGTGTIGALINDKSLLLNIQSTVSELHETLKNFDTTSAKSRQLVANLVHFSTDLNRQGTSINKLITDTAMFATLNAGITKLEQAAGAAAAFADSLKETSGKLNRDDNAVGVLLNDTVTANHVKALFKNLETSSHKLDEDLEAAQHNFLLRGFFRKKENAKADTTHR